LNVSYVPLPVLGVIQIKIRRDGRFGVEDPLNHPQIHCSAKPYLALIPSRPPPTHPSAILWGYPSLEEFVRANDHPEGEAYGWLESSRLDSLKRGVDPIWSRISALSVVAGSNKQSVQKDPALQELKAGLRRALKMFDIPCTYRDLVRQWGNLHRCFAECWAWLDWQRIQVDDQDVFGEQPRLRPSPGIDGSGVKGVFCTDASNAFKWLQVGVSVWLLYRARAAPTSRALPKVAISLPTDVVQDLVDTVYSVGVNSTVGDEQVTTIWRMSEYVLDVERIPHSDAFQPADVGAPAVSSTSTSAIQGRAGPSSKYGVQ
jgi:hypothetical protein